MSTWLRSRDLHYAAIVSILAILSLLPALAQPSHLVHPSWSEYSDLTLIHWPKALLIRESLMEGNGWPLWSSYALSGQPLAANQLAMIFYPPALLLLVGPVAWAFTLFYALHLVWAGVGTYWFVRSLGLRRNSALLAGVIFALCGKLAAHVAIGHASLVAAISWTPWAFAFLNRTLTQPRTTGLWRVAFYASVTGVALAAQATTHTYALVLTGYGLLLWTILYLALAPGTVKDRLRTMLGRLPGLTLIPLVAVLLGAAQFLPLLEMAPYSNRSLSLAEATLFSLSPAQTLTGILLPTPDVGHEWTVYPGLLTLGLAAAAWYARRDRGVVIVAILTALGIVLALGSYTPVYQAAYNVLPGLRWIRTPARLWFFVTLGLAVLAAYGLDAWQQLWRHPARGRIRLTIVAGMGFALSLSVGVMIILDQGGRAAWRLGVFGALSGALLLWATQRRPKPAFAWLALLVVVADLLSFDLTMLRFVPYENVAARGRHAAEWLAAQPGFFRTYSPSYSLPQPIVSETSLQQIDGVEPVHLTDYDRFMALAGDYDEGLFSVTIPPFPDNVPLDQAHRNAQPDLHLLGLLNGQYLAAAFPLDLPGLSLCWQGGNTWLYENKFVLPRAFVIHQTEPVTHQDVWDKLDTLDLARVALVEDDRRLDGPSEPTPARIVEYSPNRVVVETSLEAPGLLVLSEIWYPGWQVLDNGNLTPIFRTDAILRGVYLDSGSHTVEFTYTPWTVWIGLAISVSAVIALLALAAYGSWRRT